MSKEKRFAIVAMNAVLVLYAFVNSDAATISGHKTRPETHRITETTAGRGKKARGRHSNKTIVSHNRPGRVIGYAPIVGKEHRHYERFSTSSFADDQGEGDITAGEDPIVRAAALQALGNMNGSVVAVDPDNGRILAMVNQKLALSAGAQPCSTIKVAVALAALSENVITKETPVPLGKHSHMSLTTALARSNNAYFETVGRELGFQRVSYYAHLFGLGELAGWGIDREHLGTFPSVELDQKLGGVGKMCSFGESVSVTPLQLAALMSSIANGGTLYYLQHPTTTEEVTSFTPKVKRKLAIGPLIPEISAGMAGAVEYGTARRLRWTFMEEPVLGKTGTCSSNGIRFGWFGSFARTQYGRIVTVIFIEGGQPTFGPKAAELTGRIYRNLYDHEFFAVKPSSTAIRIPGFERNSSAAETLQ